MKRVFYRRPPAEEVREEIRFHLDGRIEELVAAGHTREEAERAVSAEFGDVEGIVGACLDEGGLKPAWEGWGRTMGNVARDVRVALRGLRKAPGFALVAVGTLALGIGVSVAVFGVVNAVLLTPLPFEDPEGLVQVWPTKNFNKAMVDEVALASPSLEQAVGVSQWGFTLTGEGSPEQLTAKVVGVNFFDVLGLRPALGRDFRISERDPGQSGVVILSHAIWERRYGGDPDVIGRTIRLDGYDHTSREVIGVMGTGASGALVGADVWVPLHQPPGKTVVNDSSYYVNTVIARLAPGASLASAGEEMATIARQYRQDHPGLFTEESVASAGVVPLREAIVGETGRTLWLVLAAVGLILLIACANLANVLLARGSLRQREVAIQTALGATRSRIFGQRMTESLLLGILGGGLGVVLAWFALSAGEVLLADRIPRGDEIQMGGSVLGFAIVVSLAASLFFGTAPALRQATGHAAPALAAGGGRSGMLGRTHRLNRLFVGAELALAVIIVVCAGLVARSFVAVWSTDPGFDATDVTVVRVALTEAEEQAPWGTRSGFYDEVVRRMQSVPGVEAVAGIHLLPMTDGNWSFPYLADGFEAVAEQPLPVANFRVVVPGLFPLLKVPLLRGRLLADSDGEDDPPAGLINAALAEAAFPGQDPIGREIRIFGSLAFTVVGVVGNMRQHALTMAPLPELYRPFDQWPLASMSLMVRRAQGGPDPTASLRQVVWDVAPDVPVPMVRPLSEALADSASDARFLAGLFGAFGLLALGLGAVGVYGVMSYITGARRPEWSLRLALGAAPESIRALALRTALSPVLGGVVVGLLVSSVLTRLLDSMLYEIQPLDPATFAIAPLVLVGVAVLATYLPARRAARADPMQALGGD